MLVFVVLCVLVPLSFQQCLTPHDEVRKVREDVVGALRSSELAFSADMIRTVSSSLQGDQNAFFSPASVFQALLMSYFIAANQTEAGLKRSMHLEDRFDKLDYVGAYHLENYYRKMRTIANTGCQSNLANRLYVARDLKVQPCLNVLFNNELQSVKFRNNEKNIRRTINRWVEFQTNRFIKDFLSEEHITSDTDLVLLNAAYFKGRWKIEFNPEETKPAKFYLNNGTKVDCELMVNEGNNFKLYASEKLEAEVVELPYKSKDISMFLMLPQQDTPTSLQTMLQKIDAPTLKSMVSEIQAIKKMYEVHVLLPKFTLEETLQLTPILEKMGVGDLFQESADLSTLTGANIGLKITDAVHKAKIKIDEKGTEAGAATALITTRVGPPLFRLDRPFAYTIYDKTVNQVLFFGVFNSPP